MTLSNAYHKQQIAKFVFAKLGIIFRYYPFFTCEQFLVTACICLEDLFIPITASKKTFRLIDAPLSYLH